MAEKKWRAVTLTVRGNRRQKSVANALNTLGVMPGECIVLEYYTIEAFAEVNLLIYSEKDLSGMDISPEA